MNRAAVEQFPQDKIRRGRGRPRLHLPKPWWKGAKEPGDYTSVYVATETEAKGSRDYLVVKLGNNDGEVLTSLGVTHFSLEEIVGNKTIRLRSHCAKREVRMRGFHKIRYIEAMRPHFHIPLGVNKVKRGPSILWERTVSLRIEDDVVEFDLPQSMK